MYRLSHAKQLQLAKRLDHTTLQSLHELKLNLKRWNKRNRENINNKRETTIKVYGCILNESIFKQHGGNDLHRCFWVR